MRSRDAALAFIFFGSAALTPACVGEIGDPDEPIGEAEGPVCTGEIAPGRSPIRRLTKFEYNNTVRDLLGDVTLPANVLPAEEEPLGFSNDATSLNVTPVLAEKYMLVAEGVATRATEDVATLTGCAVDGDPAALEGCAVNFIETFGRRALRRPLTEAEVEELTAVYGAAWEIYADAPTPGPTSYRMGIQMVVEAILQSPAFLYRVELGEGLTPVEGAVADARVMPLTSLEMASRLSYFLWGSMPDEDLLTLGEQDKLSTKEEIAAQARRMLDDDKAKESVAMFHQQWLDSDRVSNVTKDPALYPEWSPALAELMKEEMRVFIEQVIFAQSGDLKTLLGAPFTFADEELAAHYGVQTTGDAFEKVDFPAEERAGLLTMGALLSYYAHTNQTSPVHRGKLIREAFLCDILDPPPADVMFELPEPDPSSTARERFSEHSSNVACKGCHELMDPLGFGFENFDTLGRFRTTETGGQPIDASGSIIDSDIDGSFVGVRELADKLAESDDVKSCYAKMWFRYAYGRGETKQDACSLQQIDEAFEAADGNVKELLVALTQSDAFLYRLAGPTEGGE